jgi:CopG family transcriptional regulator, nickel-responsive regulator
MENNPTTPNITRFGITFPPELLTDFDQIITKMGYESRSKAIQDAVRFFVAERKWLQQDDTNPHTGIILMIYEHHTPGLGENLTESQHHHKNIITSSMHIHINQKDCLEVIAIKGKVSEVKELNDQLATRRGVKLVKTIMAV